MTNKTISLDLTNSSIDQFSGEIDSFLRTNGIPSKDIAMQRLLIEDTLVKYQAHFDKSTPTRLEFKVTKHGCAFTIAIPGEEMDLLFDDEADELSLLSSFIEKTENNLAFHYHHGENILKCAFHHDARYTLYKLLKSIGIPIALFTLIHTLTHSVDALMLGSISQECLSAVALSAKVTEVFLEIVAAFVFGCSSLITNFWGRKDKASIEQTFGYTARLLVILGTVFTLLCAIIPRQILSIFTNDARLLYIGTQYLRLYSPFYLLSAISEAGIILVSCCGRTRKLFEHALILFVAKIILNYLFIHGIDSIEGMGVSGAALVSVMIATAEAVIIVGEFTEEGWLSFKLKYFLSVPKRHRKLFIKHTFWAGFEAFSLAITNVITTSIVGHCGNLDVITGFSLATSIAAFSIFAYKGLYEAGSIVVGYEHGRRHLHKIKVYGQTLVKLSAIVGLITALVYFGASFPVAFSHSHFTRGALVAYISISAFYAINRLFCSIYATIQLCTFSTSTQLKTAFLVPVITTWVFSNIPAIILSQIDGITNITVIAVLLFAPFFNAAALYILYRKNKWVRI